MQKLNVYQLIGISICVIPFTTLLIPEPSTFLGLISFGFLTLGSIRNKIKS